MKIFKKIQYKLNHKKWKLYLYYNGILIKKIKIDESEAPANNNYVANVYFKKKLFGYNIANVIVKPVTIIRNDEKKRKTYWGTVLDQGIKPEI